MLIARKRVEQRRRNPLETVCSANLTAKEEKDTGNAESTTPITAIAQLIEPVEQIQISEVSAKMSTSQNSKRKRSPVTKTPKEKMPLNSVRFNGLQHNISFDDPNGPRKGHRCKREGCGQSTTVFCEACNVHLCFVTGKNGRNCFKKFHILNES